MVLTRERPRSSAGLLGELAIVVASGWGLYALLNTVRGPAGSVLSFPTLLERSGDEPWYRFLWFLADTNEAQSYASIFGGLALLTGAFVAHRLDCKQSRWRGFAIVAGTGLWPWLLAASLLGLAISVSLYGFVLKGGEWIPTFVPFVSVPAGVVLIYGGGWRTVLAGGVLGGLIGFPIAYAVITVVLAPVRFPAVIGNVTGMWLGGIIVFELCHRARWWFRPLVAPRPIAATARGMVDGTKIAPIDRPGWLARRTLADLTEAQFYGNEIASAALLCGVMLGWALDSSEAIYGSGLLPSIITGQVMASALGIVIYRAQWRRLGWYPTFVPVVSVVPGVVLTFGGGVAPAFAGAVLGALLGPPIAQFGIDRIPGHWHPFVASTFSMAVSTAGAVAVLLPLPSFHLPS